MYALWLADACRETGYPVHEVSGWQTRGVRELSGLHGVVGHWTAGPSQSQTASNTPSLQTIINGRTDLKGPLSQVYTAFDGSLYVVAAGVANHAGTSQWLGETDLNNTYIGNEVESPGDFVFTAAQNDVAPRLHAAILRRMARDSRYSTAHYEVATPIGRKIDGPSRNMAAFRSKVGAYLANPATINVNSTIDILEDIMSLYGSAAEFEAGVTRAILAAMDQRLGRLVMALDGRGNSVFNGDNVADNPPLIVEHLAGIHDAAMQIVQNTAPPATPPTV